jgi:hypothetical protein
MTADAWELYSNVIIRFKAESVAVIPALGGMATAAKRAELFGE